MSPRLKVNPTTHRIILTRWTGRVTLEARLLCLSAKELEDATTENERVDCPDCKAVLGALKPGQ